MDKNIFRITLLDNIFHMTYLWITLGGKFIFRENLLYKNYYLKASISEIIRDPTLYQGAKERKAMKTKELGIHSFDFL